MPLLTDLFFRCGRGLRAVTLRLPLATTGAINPVTIARTVVAAPHCLVRHLNSVSSAGMRLHLNVILGNLVVMPLSPAVMLNSIAMTATRAKTGE